MAYKAYKYRIYPNKDQQLKFNQFFGCCRFIYNRCLENYNKQYEQWKINKTPFSKTPLLTEFKKEYTFLKDCDNAAIAFARMNYERAVNDFFKSKNGKRKGKSLGFPKFKKKGVGKDTYRTCDAHGGIRFNENNQIKLPKIGWVNVKKHRDYCGVIKAVTITRTKSGKYYIVLMTECPKELPIVNKIKNINNLNVVGLDMSMDRFVVSSDESDDAIAKYVRLYRKNEKHLRRLNRQHSRKKFIETEGIHFSKKYNKEIKNVVPSKNREKARIRLARLSEKISNQRRDYCIKTALYFARKYDVIVLEDINMQNMSRTLRLGKSVNDLGFGEFRRWLEYEGEKYDSLVYYADKWFASSKTCHECGEKNSLLRLSDREWVCPHCGSIIDRDRNAAMNLRDYFIDINTAGTAGINACGDTSSTLRKTLLQVVSRKQEAPSLMVE